MSGSASPPLPRSARPPVCVNGEGQASSSVYAGNREGRQEASRGERRGVCFYDTDWIEQRYAVTVARLEDNTGFLMGNGLRKIVTPGLRSSTPGWPGPTANGSTRPGSRTWTIAVRSSLSGFNSRERLSTIAVEDEGLPLRRTWRDVGGFRQRSQRASHSAINQGQEGAFCCLGVVSLTEPGMRLREGDAPR